MNENSSEVKIRIVIKLIHNTYTVPQWRGKAIMCSCMCSCPKNLLAWSTMSTASCLTKSITWVKKNQWIKKLMLLHHGELLKWCLCATGAQSEAQSAVPTFRVPHPWSSCSASMSLKELPTVHWHQFLFLLMFWTLLVCSYDNLSCIFIVAYKT